MKLTVEKVREYARKNYCTGGDVIIECWEDKEIQEFLDKGYTLKDFRFLMDVWYDRELAGMYPDGVPSEEEADDSDSGMVDAQACENACGNRSCSNCAKRHFRSWSGWDNCMSYEMAENEEACHKAAAGCPRYEEGNPDGWGEDEHYTPSATAGDYSPSSPWNAPGMSVRDFI